MVRDALREFGVLLIGIGGGAAIVDQKLLYLAVVGVGIAMVLGSWVLRAAEERGYLTEAFNLTFDPSDPRSAQPFNAQEIAYSWPSPFPVSVTDHPATTLRLHAWNLRTRPLQRVRVRLVDVRRVSDGSRSHPHSDWLKWMHDDTPTHPASVEGREMEPKADDHAYLDTVTKIHDKDEFLLDFAMPHLRDPMPLPAEPHYIRVAISGVERERPVPTGHFAFLFEVGDDGSPTLSPRTLAECGFTP